MRLNPGWQAELLALLLPFIFSAQPQEVRHPPARRPRRAMIEIAAILTHLTLFFDGRLIVALLPGERQIAHAHRAGIAKRGPLRHHRRSGRTIVAIVHVVRMEGDV